MLELTVEELLDRFHRGDRRACGQILSLVENESEEATVIFDKLYPLMGRAYRIGITGPPGAGKSTLVENWHWSVEKQGKRWGLLRLIPVHHSLEGRFLGTG